MSAFHRNVRRRIVTMTVGAFGVRRELLGHEIEARKNGEHIQWYIHLEGEEIGPMRLGDITDRLVENCREHIRERRLNEGSNSPH